MTNIWLQCIKSVILHPFPGDIVLRYFEPFPDGRRMAYQENTKPLKNLQNKGCNKAKMG